MTTQSSTTSGDPSGHTRSSGLALLGWVGFVLLLFYATLLGGGYGGTQAVAIRTLSLFIVALGLLVWAVLAWRSPDWRPSTAIWPAVVLPLAAMAITTALSPLPRLGVEYLAWAVLLFALYLLLVRIMAQPIARQRMGGVAALLAFIVGIAYVVLVVSSWIDWWNLIGRFAAPMLRPAYAALSFGGPNVVAPVMVLLTAAAFGGIRPESRARKALLSALAVLMLLVVLLAASRASWFALAGAIAIVGVALLVANRSRLGGYANDPRWRRIGIIALVAAIPLALVLTPTIVGRLMVSGDGGRSSYFAAAVRMFEASPLTGGGTGTWAVRRATNTTAADVDWYVNHAHNVYLQTLGEMGLVGALAGIVAVAAVAWLVWRGLRSVDADGRRWAWAALFGLVYLALHDLLDFYANMPVVLIAAAIPVAVLDATSTDRLGLPGLAPSARATLERAARLALALGCAIAVAVLIRTEGIAATHQHALQLTDAGDLTAAQVPADAAANDDPGMIPYLVTSASLASVRGDWQAAHDAYRKAAETDDLPANWLGLAQAQIELGLPAEDALHSLDRALRLGQRQPAIDYAAASLYDRLGEVAAADAAYVRALVLTPSLAADASWQDDPMLRARFPALIDAAIAQAGSRSWEIALMSGDPVQARTLAGPGFAQLVIDAWTGNEEALAAVQAMADASPSDSQALSWAARLSDRAGDHGSAERYRRIASFDNEVGAVAGEVRVGGTDLQARPVNAARTDLYGQMLYRRPMPTDLLAPGLPRLVYLDAR